MGKFKDLVGMKFGRLTILYRSEDYIDNQGKHLVQWHCICDCGNECDKLAKSISSGLTSSCGCLQKEAAIRNGKLCKKQNVYDLSKEYGIGYTSTGKEFYFDLEDYNKIKDIYWRINNKGYLTNTDNNDKRILLHRLITETNGHSNIDIDHINHNTLDNRKQNLRVVTRSQNQMNKKILSRNTSGTTGVNYDNTHNVWVARIGINKKRIHLGNFVDKEDAIKARKEAEEKYFGKYSYKNSTKGNMCNEQNREIETDYKTA